MKQRKSVGSFRAGNNFNAPVVHHVIEMGSVQVILVILHCAVVFFVEGFCKAISCVNGFVVIQW